MLIDCRGPAAADQGRAWALVSASSRWVSAAASAAESARSWHPRVQLAGLLRHLRLELRAEKLLGQQRRDQGAEDHHRD